MHPSDAFASFGAAVCNCGNTEGSHWVCSATRSAPQITPSLDKIDQVAAVARVECRISKVIVHIILALVPHPSFQHSVHIWQYSSVMPRLVRIAAGHVAAGIQGF